VTPLPGGGSALGPLPGYASWHLIPSRSRGSTTSSTPWPLRVPAPSSGIPSRFLAVP
jgi:hypothetical protein